MEKEQKQKLIWDEHWKKDGTTVGMSFQTKFAQEAYRVIDQFIGEKDKRILEVGSGTGRFCLLLAQHYPDSQIIGIDISNSAIKIANKSKQEVGVSNVTFKRESLFEIQHKSEYFDVVFSEGVIEHFSPEDQKFTYKEALREMIRVTKKNGKVIIAVPNWYCFPHTLYKWILKQTNREFEYGYEKSFKHEELVDLFKGFGLDEIELSAWYPAHALRRLGRYSRVFSWAGKVVDLIQFEPFVKRFGFEVLIKGIKQ